MNINPNVEFNKFQHRYKKKLQAVEKENKLTDIFDMVDEALKRLQEEDKKSEMSLNFDEQSKLEGGFG